MTAYSPTFTRPNRPARAAAALAGLAFATAALAGSAWRAPVPDQTATAAHNSVQAPMAQTVGAADPYEIQADGRPDPLALTYQAPPYTLTPSMTAGDDPYEVIGNRRPDSLTVPPEFRAYQARQQALARR